MESVKNPMKSSMGKVQTAAASHLLPQRGKTFLERILTGSMKKKLSIGVSLGLIAGVSIVLLISNHMNLKAAQMDAELTNFKLSSSLGQLVRNLVEMNNARARSWVVQNPSSEKVKQYLEGDASLVGIQVIDLQTKVAVINAFQSKFLEGENYSKVSQPLLEKFIGENSDASLYEMVEVNQFVVHRLTSPFIKNDESGKIEKVISLYINPEVFQKHFESQDIEEKFMFDAFGNVFARSPDLEEGLFVGREVPSHILELAKDLQKTKSTSKQQKVTHKKNQASYFIGIEDTNTGVYVAVSTPENKILQKISAITRRSIFLGAALLSIALWMTFIFADSIVNPLLRLVSATRKLAQGDFSVRTQPTTRDELAILTQAFNSMAEGLAERERIKEVFGKFHSKGVLQKMMEEERIKLGGDRIPVTVFFSDIRSFTSVSEKMNPEQVVEMLNEYMGEMVDVIERFEGDVDKYVGDAIMAIWGISMGDPKLEAERSVLACLEMREKLKDLNARRKVRGEEPIKIGMGLNSGEVVFGKIGSPHRMEYTVIGDTVNTASRMESLTKEMGTDLLINESTYQLLPRPEIFEFEGPFETAAKGKAEKVHVYGCKGIKPEFASLLLMGRKESLETEDQKILEAA